MTNNKKSLIKNLKRCFNFPHFVSSIAKQLKHLEKNRPSSVKIVGIFFIAIFLCLNIIFSQTINPFYFNVVNDDRRAVALMLKKFVSIPEFKSLLILNENIYGKSVAGEIHKEDIDRKKLITEYEQLLEEHPSSRDILRNLYLLYNEDGNKNKAQEYLKRARKIDPSISY